MILHTFSCISHSVLKYFIQLKNFGTGSVDQSSGNWNLWVGYIHQLFRQLSNLTLNNIWSFQWGGLSAAKWFNHRQFDCLSNCLFRMTTKETSKFCIIGPLWEESNGQRWIPLTMGQKSKSVSMSWWLHLQMLLSFIYFAQILAQCLLPATPPDIPRDSTRGKCALNHTTRRDRYDSYTSDEQGVKIQNRRLCYCLGWQFVLTNRGRVTYICVNRLEHHWFS